MTHLDDKTVLHIANLAKLKLKDEEVPKLKDQLSEIISFVEELSKVNTDDVEETSQTTGLIDVLRDDTINAERVLTQDEVVSGTNEVLNGQIIVSRVINKPTQ